MYLIEKEIPIPSIRRGLKGFSKYPLRNMEVGDSFFMPEEDLNPKDPKMTSIYTTASKIGIKICIRRPLIGGGRRIWRTK